MHSDLAPSDPGAALPFTLTPFLTATTLLWSRTPLFYGTGADLGLDSGAPALNTKHTHYFTGGYPHKAGHPLEGSCQEGKHPPYTPFCIFLPRYVAWHLAADLPFRPHPCLQRL